MLLLRSLPIHNDTSLKQIVIPGLTRNPVFVWIPAFAAMKYCSLTHDALYSFCFTSRPRKSTMACRAVASNQRFIKNICPLSPSRLQRGILRFSTTFRSEGWRRRESNPGPKAFNAERLHTYPLYLCLAPAPSRRQDGNGATPEKVSPQTIRIAVFSYPAVRRLIPSRRKRQVRRKPPYAATA